MGSSKVPGIKLSAPTPSSTPSARVFIYYVVFPVDIGGCQRLPSKPLESRTAHFNLPSRRSYF